MILSLGIRDILSSLGIITVIAVNENDNFFIIQKLKILGFSSHFYAYEMIPIEHFLLLKSQDICKCSSFPLTKTIVDGNFYV